MLESWKKLFMESKVKAAGGVRTPEDMVKIVAAGADRIGTSAGCSLVKK